MGSDLLARQLQQGSSDASALGTSNNDAGSTQTSYQPVDTRELQLPAAGSFSKTLQSRYLSCPAHGLSFHSFPDPRVQTGPSPMERYLEEGPAAQHALFVRADTGRLSTVRDCTCRAHIDAGSRGRT